MRKFFIIDTTVIEEDSIDESVIKELACTSQATTMGLTQGIFLKNERLIYDFVEDGKCQIQVVLTLQEVVNLGVFLVEHTFALMLYISLRQSTDVLDLLSKLCAHITDQLLLILLALIENILFFFDF